MEKKQVKRKRMTNVGLYHLMHWMTLQDKAVFATKTYKELKGELQKYFEEKELPFDCTDRIISKAMADHGLKWRVVRVCKIKEIIPSDDEMLTRVKRLEKFVAKYFTEEWANLV